MPRVGLITYISMEGTRHVKDAFSMYFNMFVAMDDVMRVLGLRGLQRLFETKFERRP